MDTCPYRRNRQVMVLAKTITNPCRNGRNQTSVYAKGMVWYCYEEDVRMGSGAPLWRERLEPADLLYADTISPDAADPHGSSKANKAYRVVREALVPMPPGVEQKFHEHEFRFTYDAVMSLQLGVDAGIITLTQVEACLQEWEKVLVKEREANRG